MSTEVRVPDLGESKGVVVLDVLVKQGDKIAVDDPLITLESEKASMDVPSTVSGVIESVSVKKGQEVSSGTVIVTVQATVAPETKATAAPPVSKPAPSATSAAPAAKGDSPTKSDAPAKSAALAPQKSEIPVSAAPPGAVDLVVLGAGVGGYTAAFRAADLGLKVTLIERWPMLGGVCLNVGCIPSKALLHAAKVIEDAADMSANGITFGEPQIDRDRLRAWKNKVTTRLTNGLNLLAKQRKVEVVRGEAKFTGPHALDVKTADGPRRIEFKQCIIAAGSEVARLPGLPDDPRVIDSTGALELPADCKRLLVIGGGIIGLEMACVYDALGVKVSVVELSDSLMPGTDKDLVRPLQKRIEKRYERILLKTKVAKLEVLPEGLRATFDGPENTEPQLFDRVLVAVGRTANGNAKHIAPTDTGLEALLHEGRTPQSSCGPSSAHSSAAIIILPKESITHASYFQSRQRSRLLQSRMAIMLLTDASR